MTKNIETNLRRIIEVSTRKAAIEEWKAASEKQMVPLYNYRLDHIEEVVVLAKYIASGTDANMDVVILAAWLHDLAKPGIGGIPAEHHGIASAKLAEDILTEEGIDSEKIAQVLDAIRKHVGLTIRKPLQPIEAQILWEADKILKLGMIGFIQGLLNGIRLFPGRSMSEIADGFNEFIPLASDITECMVTERGKELARKRLESIKDVTRYLNEEIGLRI
ncbi:MAG: HD domain-containing protein [Promethearchaeota archaeon]